MKSTDDFATRLMVWDDAAASVLSVADIAPLIRVKVFALFVDAEHASAGRTLKVLGADMVKIDGTCIEALGGDDDQAFVAR